MSYTIRRARPTDIEALARLTVAMAVETENRHLDAAALAKGMHTTFIQPNLADYYVAVAGAPVKDADAAGTGGEADSVAGASAGGASPPAEEKADTTVEEAGQVVAFMMTTPDYRIRTATTVQLIQTVYVDPSHRRHGLFRRFYEHVKAQVEADATCEGIWLYVEEENRAAIQAYERMGMRREDATMMRWSKCGF